MSAKDNFNQAMNDMFGVARGENESPAKVKAAPAYQAPPAATPMVPVTYVAAGTVIEGTIKAEGDVEIAGVITGEIKAGGIVTLHTDVKANITAGELRVPGCSLTGDVDCTGKVSIGSDAVVNGSVKASEINVAGKVYGDLEVQSHVSLENTAVINGKITTNTMSMNRGAIIRGGIEMRDVTIKAE